ncbi:hypothetical protein ACPDME_003480 [Vibrio cholerae]
MGNYLDIWFSVTAIVFVVCLFSALFVGFLGKNTKILVIFTGMAIISVMLFFSQKYQIRTLLSKELSAYSFVIESHEEFNESKLLDALKNRKYVTTHKARPLSKSKVRIVVNYGEIELLLAEDSKNSSLFWVYYPKYRYSRLNPIGKVHIR